MLLATRDTKMSFVRTLELMAGMLGRSHSPPNLLRGIYAMRVPMLFWVCQGLWSNICGTSTGAQKQLAGLVVALMRAWSNLMSLSLSAPNMLWQSPTSMPRLP